jgi:hypothetical protein
MRENDSEEVSKQKLDALTRAFVEEAVLDSNPPTRPQTLERAARFASEGLRGVDIQIRRMGSTEPEDSEWDFRTWMDIQFLIIALWAVRQGGQLAARVDEACGVALIAFDEACPNLGTMRHVFQHFDEYSIDHQKRRQRRADTGDLVGRRALEVGWWSSEEFWWLGGILNIPGARASAAALCASIRQARDANS